MRVHVDDARRNPLAGRIDNVGVLILELDAHLDDFAVANEHIGIVESFAGAGQNDCASDKRRCSWHRLIATRERRRATVIRILAAGAKTQCLWSRARQLLCSMCFPY